MLAIADTLYWAAWCTFLATAAILPIYLWRSWRGFVGWVAYFVASFIALMIAAADLWVSFSDRQPGGVLACLLSIAGIALSVRLLAGEIWGRAGDAQHPWFGGKSGPI